MKVIFLFLSVSLFLLSCNEGRVYEKHLDPETELEWFAKDTMEFKVDIADTSVLYNISLAFRYAQGFPATNLKVELQHATPEGNQRFQMHQMEVRDESGKYIGEGMGDIWDLERVIISEVKFKEKGIHTYRITPSMPMDPVPLVMEVGLIVEKDNK